MRTVIYEHSSDFNHANMSMCMFASAFARPNYPTNGISPSVWVTHAKKHRMNDEIALLHINHAASCLARLTFTPPIGEAAPARKNLANDSRFTKAGRDSLAR